MFHYGEAKCLLFLPFGRLHGLASRVVVAFDIKDVRGTVTQIVPNHQYVTVPLLADEIAAVVSAGEEWIYQETRP